MPRADRVMDLADLLRSRESFTVGGLAAELGVSARTVHRDLATLRERGLPLRGDAGRGGGVRLDGDRARTVELGLAEIVALWMAAQVAATTSRLPWDRAVQSAMRKLFATLPSERARELRSLARRVVVGSPASAAVRATAGAPSPALVRAVERAFAERRGLAFRYVDRLGARSERRIEPHGLLVEPPVWYLLARDLDKKAARMFRMDRIKHPSVLADRFEPDLRIVEQIASECSDWQPLSASPHGSR
jgi:predicted DNA-binding transcriptional regulator YafY